MNLLYLGFVVSPGQELDETLVFVEGEMGQIKWTESSEAHGGHPSDVTIAVHYCQLHRAWCHDICVEATKINRELEIFADCTSQVKSSQVAFNKNK